MFFNQRLVKIRWRILEVSGDQDDFIPIFNKLSAKDEIKKDVQRAINLLKNDQIPGMHLKLARVPKYYRDKHDINTYYKVSLPQNWRLIYGILSINEQKKALLIELFDHKKYDKRFNFKKR